MIKYGIHTGKFDTDPTDVFRTIKSVGFDAVLINLSGEFPNDKQTEIIRRVGLDIDNCHSPWDNINHLWKNTLKGEGVYEMLRDNLIECGRYGIPRAVWHVSAGNGYPPISQIGMDRVAKLVEVADKNNVDICLENQRFFHFIDYIYAHIDSPRLKFCYDSGHEACFSQTKLALAKYRSRLAALHLHDNHGVYNEDEHLMPGKGGAVDFDYIRKQLEDYEGVISLELKRNFSIPAEEFFSAAFESAKFVKS